MTGPPLIDRPVIIIGCNRSGTTLLFNNLSAHPLTWSSYLESQKVYTRHYPVDPQNGERIVGPPPPEIARVIESQLYHESHNKEVLKDRFLLRHVSRRLLQRPLGRLYRRPPVRLVEKTPANTLRIPFLDHLFPDAKFLFLVRRGEDVVSSLMEGWKNWSKTGRNEWHYGRWHYLVPPGWQEQVRKPLQEICAFQWMESTRLAWADLSRLRPGRFLLLRHEDLMKDPVNCYGRILEYCEIPDSTYFKSVVNRIGQRVFTTGGSAPREQKWRDLHGDAIERIQPLLAPVNALFYP